MNDKNSLKQKTTAGRRRPALIAISVTLLVAIVGFIYWSVDSKTRAETERAVAYVSSECQNWINKEYNDGRSGSRKAVAMDFWPKNGHLVVEIGWKASSTSSSYSTRLCVVDMETGKMFSPGALGRANWENY